MAESGKRFVLFWDFTTGETRYGWRLRAATGESLAFSPGSYTNKRDCESAIEHAQREHPDTSLVDLTLVSN